MLYARNATTHRNQLILYHSLWFV